MLQGADAAEAADLARKAVADGYDVLVVMGGDGMVHLACRSLAGYVDRAGHHPHGHRQRRRALSRTAAWQTRSTPPR